MNRICTGEGAALVARLAEARVLLAFDFDGTLAPIVANREAATMRSATRRFFRHVCHLYPCAVISGRSRADVGSRIEGCPVRWVIGNHGIEPGGDMKTSADDVRKVLPLLEKRLASIPGVEIEDKTFSLAVHYRQARRKRATRRAIDEALLDLPRPMRRSGGKLVVNLTPSGAPTKGEAVVELRDRAALDTALYVGDDVTDEDVFALDEPGRLVTVRVGRSKFSAARYYLRDQLEMDRLLRMFVDHRVEPRTT